MTTWTRASIRGTDRDSRGSSPRHWPTFTWLDISTCRARMVFSKVYCKSQGAVQYSPAVSHLNARSLLCRSAPSASEILGHLRPWLSSAAHSHDDRECLIDMHCFVSLLFSVCGRSSRLGRISRRALRLANTDKEDHRILVVCWTRR